MKTNSFRKKVFQSLLFYNFLFVLVTVLFCNAIPKLLIYPPYSINTEFERHIDDGYKYDNQCAVIIIFALIVSNILFLLELRKIKGWEKFVGKEIVSNEDAKRLKKIKMNCNKIPSRLYILHAFVPPIAAVLGLIATRYKSSTNY